MKRRIVISLIPRARLMWTQLGPASLALVLLLPATGSGAAERQDGFSGLTAPISLYQSISSGLSASRCRFEPSCSEYACGAVAHYGLFVGSALAADRLNRCNRAAGRHYARATGGRLSDPVPGTGARTSHNRTVPEWLLPSRPLSGRGHPCLSDNRDQSVFKAMDFAFSLMQEGDYYRAITEYKRAAHSLEYGPARALARFQVAECYFVSGDWQSAITEYGRVGEDYPGTCWAQYSHFMTGVAHYNDGGFARCRGELSTIINDHSGELSESAVFITGLSFLEEGRWDHASETFASGRFTDGGAEVYPFDLLERESLRGRDLPRRSGVLGAMFSTVLPGSGQLYSGRLLDGLRALTVNGLLIFGVYRLIDDEQYGAAYVLSGITVPFYLGNIIGAYRSAGEYNRAQRTRFVDDLMDRSREDTLNRKSGSVE